MFIRVAFKNAFRSRSLWSKGIAWWTRGPYSHVELWLAGEPEAAICFSSREGKGTGRAILDLRPNFDVIQLTTSSTDPKIFEKIYSLCESEPHKSYDWLGLLGFLGPAKVHDSRDRFCSEYVYEKLEQADCLAVVGGPDRWKVSPNQLADILRAKFGPITPLESIG